MGMRQLTRLTNAFSQKWENHWSAVELWFAFYNFYPIHKKSARDACDASGITDLMWDTSDLLA